MTDPSGKHALTELGPARERPIGTPGIARAAAGITVAGWPGGVDLVIGEEGGGVVRYRLDRANARKLHVHLGARLADRPETSKDGKGG